MAHCFQRDKRTPFCERRNCEQIRLIIKGVSASGKAGKVDSISYSMGDHQAFELSPLAAFPHKCQMTVACVVVFQDSHRLNQDIEALFDRETADSQDRKPWPLISHRWKHSNSAQPRETGN